MHQVNTCKICGNEEFLTLYKNVDDPITHNKFKIVKCLSCKNHFTSPCPSSIGDFYPKNYRKYGKFTFLILNFLYSLNVKKWIKEFGEKKTVLEVGCGSGFMLSVFKKYGWQEFGLERNKEVAMHAKRQFDINVMCKNLNEIKNKKFDLILLFNVLEHVDDPCLVIKECSRLLNKNGQIVVKVPNFDSWQSKLMKSNWFHLDVPRHLYHFNKAGLKKIIEDNNLQYTFKTSVSIEHDPYGMFESISCLFTKKNTFTNFLMGIEKFSYKIIMLVFLGILLALPILMFSLISWLFNSGALIEIRGKKR